MPQVWSNSSLNKWSVTGAVLFDGSWSVLSLFVWDFLPYFMASSLNFFSFSIESWYANYRTRSWGRLWAPRFSLFILSVAVSTCCAALLLGVSLTFLLSAYSMCLVFLTIGGPYFSLTISANEDFLSPEPDIFLAWVTLVILSAIYLISIWMMEF